MWPKTSTSTFKCQMIWLSHGDRQPPSKDQPRRRVTSSSLAWSILPFIHLHLKTQKVFSSRAIFCPREASRLSVLRRKLSRDRIERMCACVCVGVCGWVWVCVGVCGCVCACAAVLLSGFECVSVYTTAHLCAWVCLIAVHRGSECASAWEEFDVLSHVRVCQGLWEK